MVRIEHLIEEVEKMAELQVKNLKKQINGQNILNINSVTFKNQKIYGIVGPNGTGKTTFLKCVCGLLIPDQGEIYIDGKETTNANRAEYLKIIGSVFAQSDSIFDLTAEEVLEEHYYFFDLRRPKKWQDLLLKVGLDVSPKIKIGDMSLGMRQRFLLAIAISHEPQILILDEPFNGLDPDGVQQTKEIMKRFAEKNLVIVTCHSFSDLEDTVTDVVVMEKGQMGSERSLKEIRKQFEDVLLGFYHHEILSIANKKEREK